MKSDAVTVQLREPKPGSKVAAYVDITITLGEDGTCTIHGLFVVEVPGKTTRIMLPARKGTSAWFPIVELTGKVRAVVESAVLSEFSKWREQK